VGRSAPFTAGTPVISGQEGGRLSGGRDDWVDAGLDAPLKSTATVSLALNPVPVTVTVEVGGPELGFKVMLAVTAAAGDADKPTARTMPTVTVSTRASCASANTGWQEP